MYYALLCEDSGASKVAVRGHNVKPRDCPRGCYPNGLKDHGIRAHKAFPFLYPKVGSQHIAVPLFSHYDFEIFSARCFPRQKIVVPLGILRLIVGKL